MNHFSARAVKNYLGRFERAFDGKFKDTVGGATAYPHNFFNDSYEVYGADWSEGLFDEFLARRGYKLEEHLPEFLAGSVRTRPGASSPIIVKLSVNCCRRISPVSGRSGRIGTGLKPEIRLMARREI